MELLRQTFQKFAKSKREQGGEGLNCAKLTDLGIINSLFGII